MLDGTGAYTLVVDCLTTRVAILVFIVVVVLDAKPDSAGESV